MAPAAARADAAPPGVEAAMKPVGALVIRVFTAKQKGGDEDPYRTFCGRLFAEALPAF
jgi:hypothetical protein